MARPTTAKPITPRTRHSIGEWYGKEFSKLSDAERLAMANRELKAKGLTKTPCPFTSGTCNKRGGVCSLRQYSQEGSDPVQIVGSPIAVCPNRFLEKNMIYSWVGEILLDAGSPVILSEIGFLDRFKKQETQNESEEGNEDSRDFIGRIDNVLLHPHRSPLDWCALEIQAVYFSGKSMSGEFKAIAKNKGQLSFPFSHRRPDWRSSGPKRLLPQLETKVPTIRTWGKKMAVVIDAPFFESLVGLERERHASNSEIVWFVTKYEPTEFGWQMVRGDVVYTKLDASVRALTGGTPLSREAFEGQLVSKLRNVDPQHPLAKLSQTKAISQ